MAKSKRADGATTQPTAEDEVSPAATDLTAQGATPARTRKQAAKRTPKTSKSAAKQGHGKPRFTEDQVAEALKATGGIFSDAARYLTQRYRRKCSRPAVSNYVK